MSIRKGERNAHFGCRRLRIVADHLACLPIVFSEGKVEAPFEQEASGSFGPPSQSFGMSFGVRDMGPNAVHQCALWLMRPATMAVRVAMPLREALTAFTPILPRKSEARRWPQRRGASYLRRHQCTGGLRDNYTGPSPSYPTLGARLSAICLLHYYARVTRRPGGTMPTCLPLPSARRPRALDGN